MENPKNRLKWNCKEGKECFIKIRIIFDYKVEVSMLKINGLIKKYKTFLKVRLGSMEKCHTGETSGIGFYEDYQLYKESFQIKNSVKSRVFEFEICVDSGDSADIYSIDLYDKYLKRINFRYQCVSRLNDNIPNHETGTIFVSIIAILISAFLAILTIIFIIKYLQQKKLILRLTNTKVNSKWKQMKLPLAPPDRSDSRFLESGFYYEIGDSKQLMESKRKESNIKFTENIGLYGKTNSNTDVQNSPIFESTTTTSKTFTNTVYKSYTTENNQLFINQDGLNEVSTDEIVCSKRDSRNRNESFSQYSNLDHK